MTEKHFLIRLIVWHKPRSDLLVVVPKDELKKNICQKLTCASICCNFLQDAEIPDPQTEIFQPISGGISIFISVYFKFIYIAYPKLLATHQNLSPIFIGFIELYFLKEHLPLKRITDSSMLTCYMVIHCH